MFYLQLKNKRWISKAETEWAEIALLSRRETKVHTAKKCIALGWNIRSVSEKLSSGTEPPRNVAPSETPTAPPLLWQSIHRKWPLGPRVQAQPPMPAALVRVVSAAPQLAAPTSVRAPRETAGARPVCTNTHSRRTQCLIKKKQQPSEPELRNKQVQKTNEWMIK